MNYNELFEEGRLGVKVTNLKDREEFIKKYTEFDCDWESTLNLYKHKPHLIFCMYELDLEGGFLYIADEENGELEDIVDLEKQIYITNEEDEELEDIVDYEEFMEEIMEEMNYNELFEEGRLGVKTNNVNEAKTFITLFGQNPNEKEWQHVLLQAKYVPIIFCMYEGLATTNEYDEDLVEIIDYEKFTKGIEVVGLNETSKTADVFKDDISAKLGVYEDKEEQVKLDKLNREEKRLVKEVIECTIQYKQEQIEKLKQEIADMKVLLSKII